VVVEYEEIIKEVIDEKVVYVEAVVSAQQGNAV
jgi:hypothetical protein